MKGIVCASFLFFTALPLKAEDNFFKFEINKISIFQSEVLCIRQVHKSTSPFSIDFLGKKRESFLMGGYQTALIGIDYQLKPGTYSLTANFELNPGEFWSTYCRIAVKEKYPKLKYRKPPVREEKKKDEKEKEKEKIRWERLIKEKAEKKSVLGNLGLSLEKMNGFFSPLDRPLGELSISGKFGEKRRLDDFGNRRYHLGIDFRGLFGKERRRLAVLAINDGVVMISSEYLLEGNFILIDHGNGISSESLHLSRVFVKKGDWVKRGQPIGIAGDTGSARGVHLHLVIKMDKGETIVDPQKFLKLLK